jgi:hypothetical protein
MYLVQVLGFMTLVWLYCELTFCCSYTYQKGIRTYPKGYFPIKVAMLENMKIYRNNVGAYLHITSNVGLSNCYFADNALGIDLERTLSPPIRLNNITVIGESDTYRTIVRNQNLDNICSYQLKLPDYNIGIEIRTWKSEIGMTGSIWQNIQFRNFNHGSCKYVSPISMDYTVSTTFPKSF